MLRRRDALKGMAGLAGAVGLSRLTAGCGSPDDGPPPAPTIVYLMMENRSYDHALGARTMLEGQPGDGLTGAETNPDAAGAPVAVWEATRDTLCVVDPPHGWSSSRAQFAGGANDGFVTTHQQGAPGDTAPMQYLARAHQPVTWALADAYATCDRWFASVMGPTWPNRFYWLAGTSLGMTSNDLPAEGFTAPTILHRLDEAGVPFAIYYGELPFVALMGDLGLELSSRMFRIDQFFADAAAGTLPPVVYLDPPWSFADDHPPNHPIDGQEFLAAVYRALATSPQWESCLLVVTYDEHGGFYDHVPPPTAADERAAAGFDQLGFRVPTLVVGPYVKPGYVSSVVRDHTSALKHLEETFGLAPLTMRSSAAANLADLFDAERVAAGQPRPPIDLPAVDRGAWDVDAVCRDVGARTAPPNDLLAWADAHPARVARWDARGDLATVHAAIRARARR